MQSRSPRGSSSRNFFKRSGGNHDSCSSARMSAILRPARSLIYSYLALRPGPALRSLFFCPTICRAGDAISARPRQHREQTREREAHLMTRHYRVEHPMRE